MADGTCSAIRFAIHTLPVLDGGVLDSTGGQEKGGRLRKKKDEPGDKSARCVSYKVLR